MPHNMLFYGEIFTAGKKFTLLLVVPIVTNLTSDGALLIFRSWATSNWLPTFELDLPPMAWHARGIV